MKRMVVALCLCAASVCWAEAGNPSKDAEKPPDITQEQVEAAMRRLRERQARNGTDPAARPSPGARPATKRQRYRVKDSAPPEVRAWFEIQPKLKETRLKQLRIEIEQAKDAVLAAADQPVRMNRVSQAGPWAIETPSAEGLAQRNAAVEQARVRVTELSKLKRSIETNPLYMEIPEVPLRVGSFGRLGPGWQVFQVVDVSDAILKAGRDRLVWAKGIDTELLADETPLESRALVRITGTRQYTTVMGASKTVLVLERCELSDFLELASDEEP